MEEFALAEPSEKLSSQAEAGDEGLASNMLENMLPEGNHERGEPPSPMSGKLQCYKNQVMR